jgi:hypothetical protein
MARRATGRLALALSTLVAVACESAGVVAPRAATLTTGHDSTLVALTCLADRSSGTPVVTCGAAPSPSGTTHAADITVGRQNTDVTFSTSGAAYSAVTDTFRFNTTITNLLAQPIGTPDGTTITKVRAFLSSGPSVALGHGTITIAGDSVGTFTKSGQPYYVYSQIIASEATSSAVTWKFVLPTTVLQFSFAVYVTAKVPSQTGILNWAALRPAGLTLQNLNSLWAISPTDIYAVGAGSTVLHYNGTVWSLLPSPGLGTLLGVWGVTGDTVWVVGTAGGRARWNGSAWTTFTTPTVTDTLYAVWGSSTSNVYAVGQAGTILFFNGTAWSTVTITGSATPSLTGVGGTADGDTIYAVARAGVIVTNLGAGGNWNTVTSPVTTDLLGIWGIHNTFYAVGAGGVILTNPGTGTAAWTTMTSTFTGQLEEINGTSTSDIYAVGDNGAVLHYNGATWSIVTPPFVSTLYAVSDGGSGGTTWAVGANGGIYSYTGTTWAYDPAAGIPVEGIYASGPSDVWAALLGGVTLHYNGTTWAMSAAGVPLNGMWGTSSSNVFGVGPTGAYSIYNGTTWTSGHFPTTRSFYNVWGSSATNVFAVGDTGSVYQYNGSTWSAMSTGTTAELNDIWGTSSSNIFAVGNSGTIIRYNGTAWSAMTSTLTTQQMTGVWGSNATHVWAIATTGNTLSYANVGSTWTAQTTAPSGLSDLWAADSAHVYASGNSGSLWAYNGAVWYAMSSPTTSNLNAIFGTSATNVYAGGDLGIVLLGSP